MEQFISLRRKVKVKTSLTATIVMILALGGAGAVPASAQHEAHAAGSGTAASASQDKKAISRERKLMANEPHLVLARAYHDNLDTFARAVQRRTANAGSVNADFARVAVAEMRRSYNGMQKHHQAYMQSMSAEMSARMGEVMQQRVAHEAELNTRLTALEQEVQSDTPDVKRVVTLAASVRSHLETMSKRQHDARRSKLATKS